jgi:putative addiction module component (TIGR02574 family)
LEQGVRASVLVIDQPQGGAAEDGRIGDEIGVTSANSILMPEREALACPTRNGTLNRNFESCIFQAVPMTLEQIVEETRQLPTDVVVELVDRILLERHGGIEPEIDAAWKSEIDRRIEEIQTGKVQGIPVDESLARIRVTRRIDLWRKERDLSWSNGMDERVEPWGECRVGVM